MPGLLEVGRSLEEAKRLKKQHEDLMGKLKGKQGHVNELLHQADNVVINKEPDLDVYEAMAESLGEAWKDLNAQLEDRRLLLDAAILFHESVKQFTDKLNMAHRLFSPLTLPQDVDTIRLQLQKHHQTKKEILEASMETMNRGQVLLDRMHDMGTHIESKHTTTAACYGVEHMLENLHDRRRHMEEVWALQKLRLEKSLQLCIWKQEVNDPMYDQVKRLLRVAESFIVGGHYDSPTIQSMAGNLHVQWETFMDRLDRRTKYLQMAFDFYQRAGELFTWLTGVVDTFLAMHADMGTILPAALEFLSNHERLEKDMKDREPQVDIVLQAAEEFMKTGAVEAHECDVKTRDIQAHWGRVGRVVRKRIGLGAIYVAFHKLARRLANEMDDLDELLKRTPTDGTKGLEIAIHRHDDQWKEVQEAFTVMERKGREFLSEVKLVRDDPQLDTERAVLCVETLLEHFGERKRTIQDQRTGWQQKLQAEEEFKQDWLRFMQEVKKTIEWIMSLEREIFPTSGAELGTNLEDAVDLQDKLRKFMPTAEKTSEVVEGHVKTAEMLAARGETGPQKESLIMDLLRVHQRFQARLAEYILLLEMAIAFFDNINKLNMLIDKADKDFKQTSPQDAKQVEDFLRQHEAVKKDVSKVFDHTTDSGEKIVLRVRENEGVDAARVTVEQALTMLDMRRIQWLKEWEEHRRRLEQGIKMCQLLKDIEKLREQLSELADQLLEFQTQLKEAKTSHTISIIVQKFDDFTSQVTAFRYRFEGLSGQVDEALKEGWDNLAPLLSQRKDLRDRWHRFLQDFDAFGTRLPLAQQLFTNMQEDFDAFGTRLPLAQQLFTNMQEIEAWLVETTKMLFELEQQARAVKTKEEAKALLPPVEQKAKEAEMQEGRVRYVSELSVRVHGKDEGEKATRHVVVQFHEVRETITYVRTEIKTKMQTLPSKHDLDMKPQIEVIKKVETPTKFELLSPPPPKKKVVPPSFAQKLTSAVVDEGSPFRFECCVEGDPTPAITWYKDNDNIASSSIYETAFINNVASLTIAEVFVEDEARYMCKASNPGGQAICSAKLTVKAHAFLSDMTAARSSSASPVSLESSLGKVSFRDPGDGAYAPASGAEHEPEHVLRFSVSCFPRSPGDGAAAPASGAEHEPEHVLRFSVSCFPCSPGDGAAAPASAMETEPPPQPPVLNMNLQDIQVMEGEEITLVVKVTAHPQPDVYWFCDGQPVKESSGVRIVLQGVDTFSLVIKEAYPEDSGMYSFLAKNAHGEAHGSCKVTVERYAETTDTEVLSDSEHVAPTVYETLRDRDVLEGSKIRMDCVIIGTPEPEIIWYFKDKPLKESHNKMLLFEGDKCSLVINEARYSDRGEYKCVAINPAGKAETAMTLEVEPLPATDGYLTDESKLAPKKPDIPPVFVQNFEERIYYEGAEARLTCRVQGRPAPTVTWYKDDVQVVPTGHIRIVQIGDTHSVMFKHVGEEDYGIYMCVAANRAGSVSRCGHVSLKGPGMEPPRFTQELADARGVEGTPVGLVCRVTGKPDPSVVFYRDGNVIHESEDFKIVIQGDLCSLLIPEVLVQDEGTYMARAVNPAGEASTSAVLRVEGELRAPTFIRKLDKQLKVKEGRVVMLEVMVDGCPKPKVKWFMDEEPVMSQDYDIVVDGGRHALTIKEVFDEDAGVFKCRAKNSQGEVLCTCQLSVDRSPAGIPAGRIFPAGIPAGKTFSCRNSCRNFLQDKEKRTLLDVQGDAPLAKGMCLPLLGDAPPGMSWWSFGIEDDSMSGGMSPDEAPKSKATCRCTQPSALCTFVVRVPEPPIIRNMEPPKFVQPIRSIAVVEGKRAEFEGLVTGDRQTIPIVQSVTPFSIGCFLGDPQPEVTWYKDGQDCSQNPDFEITYIEGQTKLVIPEVFDEDAGKYTCKAKNQAGTAASTAELVVKAVTEPPDFTQRLQSMQASEGAQVRLEVRISGVPTPEIKWFREGAEIQSSHDFQGFEPGPSEVREAVVSAAARRAVGGVQYGEQTVSTQQVAVAEEERRRAIQTSQQQVTVTEQQTTSVKTSRRSEQVVTRDLASEKVVSAIDTTPIDWNGKKRPPAPAKKVRTFTPEELSEIKQMREEVTLRVEGQEMMRAKGTVISAIEKSPIQWEIRRMQEEKRRKEEAERAAAEAAAMEIVEVQMEVEEAQAPPPAPPAEPEAMETGISQPVFQKVRLS
uniref:Ig-like domain-containing protein n=1 Tax=Branchiostoma floridae TaxID=7739 RepID=C3Z0E4_BRAFL|eukprot:XP_002597980.1 hypothetical protein BRAFLDRAFT_79788 [Branchiostoma floridae]